MLFLTVWRMRPGRNVFPFFFHNFCNGQSVENTFELFSVLETANSDDTVRDSEPFRLENELSSHF